MGLLDYYKQFEGLSEEEVNAGLREEAAERKRKALTIVQTLDLSQTTWPELPHPYIVNAITFVARAGLHGYPRARSSKLQNELAHRHGIEASRIVSAMVPRAPERGHACTDRAWPGVADILALLSAIPDHGAPRTRPGGSRLRWRR